MHPNTLAALWSALAGLALACGDSLVWGDNGTRNAKDPRFRAFGNQAEALLAIERTRARELQPYVSACHTASNQLLAFVALAEYAQAVADGYAAGQVLRESGGPHVR